MSFDARKMSLDIPGDWSFTKISDIAGINESSISSDDSFDYIRYIDISSVSSDKMETPKLMRLDDAPSRAKRIIKQGDIIISTVRPNLKQFYLCNFEIDNHIVSTGFCVVSPKSSKYRWYLYSFLTSEIFTEYLIRVADGAAYPAFSYKEIRDAIIPLPSDEYLSFISSTSKSIFNKVHLNQQTNETLEAMAQAIFKSWFVDFDPVRAKIEATSAGRDPNRAAMAAISACTKVSADGAVLWEETEAALQQKLDRMSADQRTQLRQTAELFPGELVKSEIGEVPKGWEYDQLGNFITVKRGGSPRPIKDFVVEEGLHWTKISDATSENSPFIMTTKEFIKEDGLKKTVLLEKGSLILSNSATPGLPKFLNIDACIHDGWLYFPEQEHFTDLYLYHLFIEIRKALVAKGSGTVFTNLKTSILRNYDVVVPNGELVIKFTEVAHSIFDSLLNNREETESLTKLRDTLLPKLISGEFEL